MQVQQGIEEKIRQAFSPEHIELVNESHMHSVPANSETHFKLVLVASAFEGQRKVARHQSVYKVLAEDLAGPVHALALHLYSPQEWQAREGSVPASPDCKGGSKADRIANNGA
ncbi:BolA/IbaG family iron-sulfur metabolism protein [Spongiibacter nanhainus]|uniref:DNA-binding transcriptional regulator BolA n=1 Tax=Spongiibacter nanhainus TaxID=2794344 RepID=A0A7T4UQ28_9GAMM|nr:BolA/IbaG family iron-sulfur metabolism protein [Spongiibacter nanhainus]QQD16925.1 BolA/IbaG family iron-sulfur metabolism protein [Spongiibacter nanhainus]